MERKISKVKNRHLLINCMSFCLCVSFFTCFVLIIGMCVDLRFFFGVSTFVLLWRSFSRLFLLVSFHDCLSLSKIKRICYLVLKYSSFDSYLLLIEFNERYDIWNEELDLQHSHFTGSYQESLTECSMCILNQKYNLLLPLVVGGSHTWQCLQESSTLEFTFLTLLDVALWNFRVSVIAYPASSTEKYWDQWYIDPLHKELHSAERRHDTQSMSPCNRNRGGNILPLFLRTELQDSEMPCIERVWRKKKEKQTQVREVFIRLDHYFIIPHVFLQIHLLLTRRPFVSIFSIFTNIFDTLLQSVAENAKSFPYDFILSNRNVVDRSHLNFNKFLYRIYKHLWVLSQIMKHYENNYQGDRNMQWTDLSWNIGTDREKKKSK